MDSHSAFKFWSSERFPHFLQFETGTACNARCTFCPHDKMGRSGRASWQTILKLIQEFVPLVDAVCPFLMQEPALEPRLLSILEIIKEVNPKAQTILYSNMSAFGRDLSRRIVDAGVLDNLSVSFYGPTARLYTKWQPPLNWWDTRDNLRYLIEYRNQHVESRPRINLHYITIPELIDQFPAFARDWTGLADSIGWVHYDTFHGDVPDYGDERRYWGEPVAQRTPCPRLWNTFTVHFDGTAVPCCIDYRQQMPLGNVNECSAEAIWRGDGLDRLRQMHIEGRWDEIPLCRDCKVWEYQYTRAWYDAWINK